VNRGRKGGRAYIGIIERCNTARWAIDRVVGSELRVVGNPVSVLQDLHDKVLMVENDVREITVYPVVLVEHVRGKVTLHLVAPGMI
jgi:hypothetical protein